MTNHEDFTDELGNNHIGTSDHTPLRKDAFEKTDDEKIEIIKKKCRKYLNYTRNGLDG